MADDNQKIEVTQLQLSALIENGIEKEKLRILIAEFQAHKKEEDKQWTALNNSISNIHDLIRGFPDRVTKCRDELEDDIHAELEKHYVTRPELKVIENELNNQISMVTGKVRWTVGVIVAIGGIIQFIITLILFSYQFSKMIGG